MFYFAQRIARRLYSTVAAVFFTFLLRAAFCLVNTIGSAAYSSRVVECDVCDVNCLGGVYVPIAEYLYVHFAYNQRVCAPKSSSFLGLASQIHTIHPNI
jgi:hypothetical protein